MKPTFRYVHATTGFLYYIAVTVAEQTGTVSFLTVFWNEKPFAWLRLSTTKNGHLITSLALRQYYINSYGTYMVPIK